MTEEDQLGLVNCEDTVERSVFTFSKPLKMHVNGVETEIDGIGMRAFGTRDLPLLDRFRGQSIALAQNVVAARCDLSIEQVESLALDDFTPMADDALWQISQVARDMDCHLTSLYNHHVHDRRIPSRIIPADPGKSRLRCHRAGTSANLHDPIYWSRS
ncbi:MAG: hypothetical protein QM605_11755 [Sphingobium sp.]